MVLLYKLQMLTTGLLIQRENGTLVKQVDASLQGLFKLANSWKFRKVSIDVKLDSAKVRELLYSEKVMKAEL